MRTRKFIFMRAETAKLVLASVFSIFGTAIALLVVLPSISENSETHRYDDSNYICMTSYEQVVLKHAIAKIIYREKKSPGEELLDLTPLQIYTLQYWSFNSNANHRLHQPLEAEELEDMVSFAWYPQKLSEQQEDFEWEELDYVMYYENMCDQLIDTIKLHIDKGAVSKRFVLSSMFASISMYTKLDQDQIKPYIGKFAILVEEVEDEEILREIIVHMATTMGKHGVDACIELKGSDNTLVSSVASDVLQDRIGN